MLINNLTKPYLNPNFTTFNSPKTSTNHQNKTQYYNIKNNILLILIKLIHNNTSLHQEFTISKSKKQVCKLAFIGSIINSVGEQKSLTLFFKNKSESYQKLMVQCNCLNKH